MIQPDTKPCVICGATITRTGQGATDWARRTYCSTACVWAARKARRPEVVETKTCAGCGGTITRDTKMSTGQWTARRYCSRSCRPCRSGRCEVCTGPLPTGRKTKLPWCSKPCKAAWLAAHPQPEQRPTRAQRAALEDAEPPVRFRSEVLPDSAPRETWIQRQPGAIAVCCGRCQRRFPRTSIRLAERLLTMHRRTCGSGL